MTSGEFQRASTAAPKAGDQGKPGNVGQCHVCSRQRSYFTSGASGRATIGQIEQYPVTLGFENQPQAKAPTFVNHSYPSTFDLLQASKAGRRVFKQLIPR